MGVSTNIMVSIVINYVLQTAPSQAVKSFRGNVLIALMDFMVLIVPRNVVQVVKMENVCSIMDFVKMAVLVDILDTLVYSFVEGIV